MKIAIPLFDDRISPRFEYAPELLLATVENNIVREKRKVDLTGYDVFQRSALLKDLEVNTLICCGIPGFLIRLLDGRRVGIISPVTGVAEEVLRRFVQGSLCQPAGRACAAQGRRLFLHCAHRRQCRKRGIRVLSQKP